MSLTNHIPPIYPSKLNGAAVRDPDAWAKASSYVSRRDYQTINGVACGSGAISFIIDQAISQTAELIRLHGLSPVTDTPRFLNWLRERTVSQPPPSTEGQAGDDAGRASSARQPASNLTDVFAGVGTDVTTGSGGRRRKGRAGKAGGC